MAPNKKRKRNNAGAKSETELVGKKPLKRLVKKADLVESAELSPEKVVSEEKVVDDVKGEDVKEPVPAPEVKKKKPCSWLKLDRLNQQVGSKSTVQDTKQANNVKGENSEKGKGAKDNNLSKGKGKNVSNSEAIVQNSGQGKETNSVSGALSKNAKRKNKRYGVTDGRDVNPSEQGKEANSVSGALSKNAKSKNKKYGGKDGSKNTHHERQEVMMEEEDDESDKTLGGLIFMCNAKTKPDCFGYQVMGVPVNKKEVVMGITPGLMLFLYDYDLKLLYGIFKASSAGGMKLEPAAFGGGFPAQVRFAVQKDCLPLPESMFKKALKGSYDERTHKFKTELTVKQVKHLMGMFRPAHQLHPGGPSLVRHRDLTLLNEEAIKEQRYLNNNIPEHHASSSAVPPRDPLYLTEQEYRNYGLQNRSHVLPRTAVDDVSRAWEPERFGHTIDHLPSNFPLTNISSEVQQREVEKHDPLFLSEKDYRTYGLRRPQQEQNIQSPVVTTNGVREDQYRGVCDPYDDSTASLVNRYLSLPMTNAPPAESYPFSGREPYLNDIYRRADINSRERTVLVGARPLTPYRQSDLTERPYSFYASREPSEFNQGNRLLPATDLEVAPVSRRYSFAGPSLSHHR